MTKRGVFKPPDRIYLQVVDSDEPADIEATYSQPFAEHEVTWCTDKIFDSDLEYRLVSRVARRGR